MSLASSRFSLQRAFVIALILVACLYYYSSLSVPSTGIRSNASGANSSNDQKAIQSSTRPVNIANEGLNLTYLQQVLIHNEIDPDITYGAATILYRPTAEDRPSITEVGQPLFQAPGAFTPLNVDSINALPAGKRVTVEVMKSPKPRDIDASALLFGVSTTYARFSNPDLGPIKEWRRWLTNGHGVSNGAGLLLTLFEATDEDLELARGQLANAGINATVQHSDSTLDMPGRYASLIPNLNAHPSADQRKYFALIDDDTFFPALGSLLERLGKYSPDKPYYIGAFTERVDFVMNHKAPMAFGGAGVFFTRPVIRKLSSLPCLAKDEEGVYLEWAQQGDHLVYNCLHNHTEVTLTYVPELHQMDQFGDASGFYESGPSPLSLHHFKSWHHFIPDRMHLAADACGEQCLLQRFQFSDDWILSNGYSVSEYPRGINFDPLQMEGTFNSRVAHDDIEDVNLSYSFGPLRKTLSKTGRKKSWHMIDSRLEGEGRVRQIYVKLKTDERWMEPSGPKPRSDSIVAILWAPAPAQ